MHSEHNSMDRRIAEVIVMVPRVVDHLSDPTCHVRIRKSEVNMRALGIHENAEHASWREHVCVRCLRNQFERFCRILARHQLKGRSLSAHRLPGIYEGRMQWLCVWKVDHSQEPTQIHEGHADQGVEESQA